MTSYTLDVANYILNLLDEYDLSFSEQVELESIKGGDKDLQRDDVAKVLLEVSILHKSKNVKGLMKILKTLNFNAGADNLVRLVSTSEIMPYTEWLKLSAGHEHMPPKAELL